MLSFRTVKGEYQDNPHAADNERKEHGNNDPGTIGFADNFDEKGQKKVICDQRAGKREKNEEPINKNFIYLITVPQYMDQLTWKDKSDEPVNRHGRYIDKKM
jgi:hypothetical protein